MHGEHSMSHALIVEDDADAAQMMAALVASDNFTVATVADRCAFRSGNTVAARAARARGR
jgi:CheY-like chemotaxis protein